MPEPKSLVRESRMQGSVRGISSLQRSWLIPTRPSLLMSRKYDLPTPALCILVIVSDGSEKKHQGKYEKERGLST